MVTIPLLSSVDKDSPEKLMALVQKGDSRAYHQLLSQLEPLIRRMIARKVPAADVEDVVQEVLVSIHKARHTYDGSRALMPWVFAIARFRLTDYLRQHYAAMKHVHVDIDGMHEFLAQPVTESTELSEHMNEALKSLPQRQQTILTLMHEQGYTAKEVGAQLGMKESAVKVAAHRAYKQMKTKLQEQ